MISMLVTPCSRRYWMAPESTPAWVVAPWSGLEAATRLGFNATRPPLGTMEATSAASIRAMVIRWGEKPYIS